MAKKSRSENSTVEKKATSDLQKRLDAINAKLGKKVDKLPGLDTEERQLKLYATGVRTLDIALSGGLPVGRITEFFGEEQSGKSLISLLAIAEAQKAGKTCMFIDAEQGYVPAWGAKLGVDNSKLIYHNGNVVEQIFTIIEAYAQEKVVDLVVIDSIAGLATDAIVDGEMGAAKYSPVALSMSRILPKIMPLLSEKEVSLILINQVRDEIGGYQKSLKTPGGRAIRHAASTRIRVYKSGSSKRIKASDDVDTGIEIECEVRKHRGGANYRMAEFRIDYEKGFDREYDLICALKSKQIATLSGAYYSIPALDKKYQGMDAFIEAINTEEGLRDSLEKLYADAWNVVPVVNTIVPVVDEEEEDEE